VKFRNPLVKHKIVLTAANFGDPRFDSWRCAISVASNRKIARILLLHQRENTRTLWAVTDIVAIPWLVFQDQPVPKICTFSPRKFQDSSLEIDS